MLRSYRTRARAGTITGGHLSLSLLLLVLNRALIGRHLCGGQIAQEQLSIRTRLLTKRIRSRSQRCNCRSLLLALRGGFRCGSFRSFAFDAGGLIVIVDVLTDLLNESSAPISIFGSLQKDQYSAAKRDQQSLTVIVDV